MLAQVGVDSQCLSYVIDAMASKFRPTQAVESQQLALIRLFFYLPETFWVTPTVMAECAMIRNVELAELHKSFINIQCEEFPLKDPQIVRLRASFLQKHHSGINDCLILAEAEDAGHNVLLTFDSDFINHLSPHANGVTLVRPVDYWGSLAIPRGVRPNKVPHPTNPLSSQNWWHW